MFYLLAISDDATVDIYDGDIEPVVYHGRTFTGRVAVREVCQAIAKYAFVVSPYPIVISAEIHCGLAQQDLLAKIFRDVFGDANPINATATPKLWAIVQAIDAGKAGNYPRKRRVFEGFSPFVHVPDVDVG